MLLRTAIVATIVTTFGTGFATAGTVTVLLDASHQGEGNKGSLYRPLTDTGALAEFVLTATSSLDELAPYSAAALGTAGTVYIDKEGAGVQNDELGGSKGISGGGGDQEEQLIVSFDAPASADALKIGLVGFKPDKGLGDGDDTLLFIELVGGAAPIMIDESKYMNAFTWTGSEEGYVDFGLLGLGSDALVSSLMVREVRGHVEVNLVQYSMGEVIPLPAPLGLGLAGLAIVGVARRRRASE
ncbi:MAG: hypothetical protein ACYTJ0_05550 [Planctomycetota bacterium]|jgi:hypothetical protein